MTTEPDAPDAALRGQMANKHVFVINATPEFLDIVRELLQDEQYNVTTTNFLSETFAQITAGRPDVIVLDLVYGQRAGWDLLAQLQADESAQGLPVVVVSTDPCLLERARAETSPGERRRYLVKPLDLDDLLGAIQDLVGAA